MIGYVNLVFKKNGEDLVAARSRGGGKSSVTPKSDGAAAAAAVGTAHGVTHAKRRGAVAAASPATGPLSAVSTSGKAVMSTTQQTQVQMKILTTALSSPSYASWFPTSRLRSITYTFK